MNFTRLFDIIHHQKEAYPQQQSLGHRVDGQNVFYSTDEVIELANNVSLGLLKLGVQPGDKIVLISYKNRPEWCIADIGIQQIGAIVVPVYPTISAGEYEYIFNDSGAKYAFVGPGDLLDKINQIKDKVPTFKETFTFEKTPGARHWEEIFEAGDLSEVERIKASIKPDDLATIIYTSGTTGNPKGVMLSHNNIVSNVRAVNSIIPCKAGEMVLSFLPLCHIFERTASYNYQAIGVSVCFTGTDNLGGDTGDLKGVQPAFFTTVPRLLEKVYEKIYNKGLELTGLKRTLFFWALNLTDDYDFGKKPSGLDKLKWAIADKLIFSKWREALGGNMKGIVTGAAACPVKIMRVFSAAGVPIREAYGLTETSPGLTGNRFEPGGALMGTVGYALGDTQLKLDTEGDFRKGEGEILAKGSNVMQGYYEKPDKTAEVMTEDGWFRTGDVGRFVEAHGKRFLKITDRKKELLKTSGGKYVAPAPIENKFKEDFLVEQMMVVGEKQKFVSALIVPAPEALKDWCKQNDIECELQPASGNPELQRVPQSVLNHPEVQRKYQEVINEYNPNFSHVEQIKKFKLVGEPWDVSTGELTPTMKLKRRVIMEKHGSDIDAIYA